MIWRNTVSFLVTGIVDLEKKIIDGKGKLRGNKGVAFSNIRKTRVKQNGSKRMQKQVQAQVSIFKGRQRFNSVPKKIHGTVKIKKVLLS